MWSAQDALKLQSANGESSPCFRPAPSPQLECRWGTLMSGKAVDWQTRSSAGQERVGAGAAGLGLEDTQMIIEGMAMQGAEPTYCMGDDVPLPVLSSRPHPLADYFKQRFAQVTACCRLGDRSWPGRCRPGMDLGGRSRVRCRPAMLARSGAVHAWISHSPPTYLATCSRCDTN